MTIRCTVRPDAPHAPFEAVFLDLPRIGEAIDTGLLIDGEAMVLRVTRVLHCVNGPDPTIQIDATTKLL